MRQISLPALAWLAVLILSGCGKSPESNPPPAKDKPPVAANVENPSTPAAPSPAAVTEPPPMPVPSPNDNLPTASGGAVDASPINLPLTEALQRYLEANSKLPRDFQTLVTSKFIKEVPKAPPGKKFAIDRRRLQVVLVEQ